MQKVSLGINESGAATVNEKTEVKERKGMLENTVVVVEDSLEKRRAELVEEFLIQRQEYFDFDEVGTIGTWQGKGHDKVQDLKVQEFIAEYKTWSYTCYDIKGKLYLELIRDSNCKYFESTTKVPEEFNLLDISYLEYVNTLEVDLCNVEYIVRDKNCIGNVLFHRIDNRFVKIYAKNLRLLYLVYVDNDKLEILKGGIKNCISLDSIFEHAFELVEGKLQYHNGNFIILQCMLQNGSIENTLVEGDVGYKEFGISDNIIIYQNVCNGTKYVSDSNIFDEKMFLYKCEAAGIEATKSGKSFNGCCSLNFELSCNKFLFSNIQKLEYYYKDNTLEIYAIENKGVKYTCYKLISKIKRNESKSNQEISDNIITYKNLYNNEIYATDKNYFDKKILISECKSAGIRVKKMKSDRRYSGFASYKYDCNQAIFSGAKEIKYYCCGNLLELYIDKGCYEECACYELISRNIGADDVDSHADIKGITSEEQLKSDRQKLVDCYGRSLLCNETQDGFVKCEIGDMECCYRYDYKKDWLILYDIETQEYKGECLKVPDCFDVVYVENIFSVYARILDLGNIQYLMTNSDNWFISSYLYVKADKLRFTQVLDEKGNMKEFSSDRGNLHRDCLRYPILLKEGNIYLPSLEYCNEDYKEDGLITNLYLGTDRVKKGSFGYEEVQKYKKKLAAR